ncbi:MAG: hypothetical protein ACRDPH_07290 [Marmoricola sp.]
MQAFTASSGALRDAGSAYSDLARRSRVAGQQAGARGRELVAAIEDGEVAGAIGEGLGALTEQLALVTAAFGYAGTGLHDSAAAYDETDSGVAERMRGAGGAH